MNIRATLGEDLLYKVPSLGQLDECTGDLFVLFLQLPGDLQLFQNKNLRTAKKKREREREAIISQNKLIGKQKGK